MLRHQGSCDLQPPQRCLRCLALRTSCCSSLLPGSRASCWKTPLLFRTLHTVTAQTADDGCQAALRTPLLCAGCWHLRAPGCGPVNNPLTARSESLPVTFASHVRSVVFSTFPAPIVWHRLPTAFLVIGAGQSRRIARALLSGLTTQATCDHAGCAGWCHAAPGGPGAATDPHRCHAASADGMPPHPRHRHRADARYARVTGYA